MFALLRNLFGGLRIVTFGPPAPQSFVATFDQAGSLALFTLATAFFLDWLSAEPGSVFYSFNLVYWIYFIGVGLVGTFLIARAQSRRPDVLALIVPALAVAPFVIVLVSLISRIESEWTWHVCVIVIAVYAVRTLRAAYRPLDIAARVVAPIVFVSILLFNSYAVFLDTTLWGEPYDAKADAAGEGTPTERLFFEQPARIAAAVDRLAPAREGEQDIFFLGFAGYGYQGVFRREALFAETMFADRYGTAAHSVQLINDDDDTGQYPLATVVGLRHALRLVGARMDRDEDVLILMLTSHGSSDGEFSVESSLMLSPEQLRGSDLRDALDAAGIKWRIVIVSACYAGKFIEPLKSPTTVVITAADAEHTSFGCADDRDLTYFGEAFLRDALPHAESLTQAFEKARASIHQRETDEGKTHSYPQMFVGGDMAAKLEALETARR